MNDKLNRHIQSILAAKHRRKIWSRFVAVLAVVVMLVTSLELSNPADAATEDNSPVISVENFEDSGTEMIGTEISEPEVIEPETVEAEITEAEITEQEVAESETTEAEIAEAEVTGAQIPEAEIAEAEIAGAQTPEAEIIDTEIPETEISGIEASETAITDNGGEYQGDDTGLSEEGTVITEAEESLAEGGDINDLQTQFTFSEDAAEFSRWITGVELERSYPLEKEEDGSVLVWSDWEKLSPEDTFGDLTGQSDSTDCAVYEVNPEDRLRFALHFTIEPYGLEIGEDYREEQQPGEETIIAVRNITSYNKITYTLPQILTMAVSETGAVYSALPEEAALAEGAMAVSEELLLQQESDSYVEPLPAAGRREIGYLAVEEDGSIPGGIVSITLFDSEATANLIEERSLDGVIELDIAASDVVLPGEERQIVFRNEYEWEDIPYAVSLMLCCAEEITNEAEDADGEGSDTAEPVSEPARYFYALQGGRSVRLSDIFTETGVFAETGITEPGTDSEDYIRTNVKRVVFSNPFFISVTPENGEEEGASDWLIQNTVPYDGTGILRVEFADESAAEFEIAITGRQTVELAIATITPVDGSYLPEYADGSAFVEEGSPAELAAADVEAFKAGAGLDAGPIEMPAAAPSLKSGRRMSLMSAAPAKAAGAGQESRATGQSRYQVFNISLGMDEEEQKEYEGGFFVNVTLPEEIEGHDFHLYHLHDGGVEEITDLTLDCREAEAVDDYSSEQILSGFSFVTESFSQFVLTYYTLESYVISDRGDTYKITVIYDDTTGIPADAELRVRQLTTDDERYWEDVDRTNTALLARYAEEATNPLVFEIRIFAGDEEIEPLEGTKVRVEISLVMDGAAEAGSIQIDGVEYTLEPAEIDPGAARVVHLTDDGGAEVIEDISGKIDADNNLVLKFETESFSDYTIQGVNNNNGLNGLPDVIYVGDEIYMQNSGDMWVTGIGSIVTETKFNNRDDYKSVRAVSTGTFRICNRNDWNNGNTGYTNQYPGKYITVQSARSEGNYPGTTPPATIPTVSNASIGLTLNLFDYDLDDFLDNRFNNKDYGDAALGAFVNHGINSGHSLKFWGSGITDSSYGAQNNYVEHGVTSIVNSNLSGGYPVLRSDGTSLDYLFTPSDGTDKKAYLNADGLFRKEGDYYVYDSNQNYAWYNPDTNKFEVYNSTYGQKSRSDGGEQATNLNGKSIGFFPFHKWDDQQDLFVNWNKNLNHHFGMSMSVPFSLPKDPKAVVDTNNNPIIFEFSGDDDLWVFIDGKLAMDIGGIHQPTSGTINFQNQTVTVNGQSQSFNFNGLYDGELHTLQVFYIERGGCDSNCMIKFNLTQYGDVEFDKVDKENPSDKLGGAVFGIYKDADCTQPLMENLKDGTSRAFVAESASNGHVKFSDIPLGDYYLKEIKAPDGYPLDSTVHPVKVYLDENSLVSVKVSIDGIDIVNPGVQIPNKKPDPITLGLEKEWKNQNGNTISAPANTSATFELKRIRNYERITEETVVEGHGEQTSHLVVGWYHNGNYHVHKEYDLIAGTQATVSWSYVDGYTGSKDCYENGTLIDKNESNVVISEALTMPAAGGTATLYIVDESEHGDAIKNINVAGQQFYGTNGGGVIHKFETITEPDPDFQYTGDPNVVNNRVTLPIGSATPWEYEFVNLPLAGRTPNTPTTYSYSYYLEEVSSVSPEGTTVIYKDSAGNVLNAAEDAETDQNGTQIVTNRVDLGALELTKNITITDADGTTRSMTQPNPWVNGTVSFTIDGSSAEGSFTSGIHHDVEITYSAGKITGYKIDSVQTPVNPAVTGTAYSILVNNLVPGDYVIKETGSGGMALTAITGGKNDANLTEQTITVTVTHGKNTANTLENAAKAAFTNNLKTINVPATKTWADINNGTAHPTIYFRLFYHAEAGDVAVDGVKLKALPDGTTSVTWQNVPERDQNGQEYVYLVKEYIQKDGGEFTEDGVSYTEAAPNGYVATEEGLSVTNTESDKYDPRTSYTGRKVWVDTANNGATRPENLTVTLMIDKTGDGPSPDDVAAEHDGTPYTPVWSKPEGANEWTYTFNSLPVYDAEWNIIHYYAVETTVDGYEQSDPDVTGTTYVYKYNYSAEDVKNKTSATISSETSLLPFMAVETNNNVYDYKYHIWTVRAVTDAEKIELIRIFNAETGSNASAANTRFVSGLPVSRTADGNVEFLFRGGIRIGISKMSGDELKVTLSGNRHLTHAIVGTLEYDYSAGSTDLQNTLKTEDYDVQKTWGSGQTPPEGAEVQFTLTATVPGTVTDDNPEPDPVPVADLTTLGIEKSVITLNGGQKEGEEYSGDDTAEAPWVYKWENLPQYDKNGSRITYSASETSYTIDGEAVDITSEGLVPPTASDATYELITTNRIPTEDISAHKYWPAGQTVPEDTHIKLAITAKLENGSEPNGVTLTPAEVTLDGKVTAGEEGEVETADTLWQYTWTNLPKYDKDGKRIIYTVAETEYKIGGISYEDLLAAANEPAHDGVDFSFTNELPGTRITVEKTWSNGGGAWPDGVSVIMTLKGSAPTGENGELEEIETLVIPDIKEGEEIVHQTAEYALSGTETSHTWYNLPMYTTDGQPISYTVDETGMTYTQADQDPVPIQNWAQAFTVNKQEDTENNKVTIDNTPLETEISLTKVWTLNGQPKPMEDGDAIEFKLYRTDADGELTLTAEGFAADKGTPTLNKILYVGGGENPGWQTVTISKLPKYVLKLETTEDGATAYYTGVAYYAVETSVTGNTRVSYTLSPANVGAAGEGSGEDSGENGGESGGEGGSEGGEGGGNTEAASSSETTDPTQSAIGTGTITIFNRDTDVDITVNKVDSNDPDKKLPNAEFQILKWRAAGEGGVYAAYNLETQDYAAEGEAAKSKLTTGQGEDDYGRLVFEGLTDGRYKIVETKTPDGYLKLDMSDIFFKIDDGTVTWTDESGNAIDPAEAPNHIDYDDLTFTVENTPGAALPNTGGPGTSRLYLIGFLLMLMAGAGFMAMSNSDRKKGAW